MDKALEIPVIYGGQELSFPCRPVILGYVLYIEVEVNSQTIKFEPDEEGNYRPILNQEQVQQGVKMDIDLLKAIAKTIESVVG